MGAEFEVESVAVRLGVQVQQQPVGTVDRGVELDDSTSRTDIRAPLHPADARRSRDFLSNLEPVDGKLSDVDVQARANRPLFLARLELGQTDPTGSATCRERGCKAVLVTVVAVSLQ